MKYSIHEIKDIINGHFLRQPSDAILTQVCIDTRQITNAAQSLFFCLSARNDGHQHIGTAFNKGIRNFIVSREVEIFQFPEANFIRTDDTLHALQQLAKHHREQFMIPVIAITGSNGKTIVKEWLFQLLSQDKSMVKSPKSYNSQVGVPLSVLHLQEGNELALFEAGISTTHEMENLERIIQPTIGLITNIGPAHDAGFSSMEQKINEKLKLFRNAEQLVYSSEYDSLQQCIPSSLPQIKLAGWHRVKRNTEGNLVAIEINQLNGKAVVYEFTIPFKDQASIENCIHCIVMLLVLGYAESTIQERILSLRNLPMRLELKYGINNCTIIDDSYSADFLSMQIAVDFLKQQETHKKKTLIISDFEESRLTDNEYIQKLRAIIKENNFEKLIGVGANFKRNIESLAGVVKEWYVFETTEALLEQFSILHFENEFILLKGARRFGFERITAHLIGQTHATVLEIDLNALIHNLNVYKGYLTSHTGIIAMVKAFSYGSGSVEVASLLEKQQVDYLAVAYADEGVELRRNGIRVPVMVMNPDRVDFDRMLEFNLEPEIYSLKILKELIHFLHGVHHTETFRFNIHLKLETGMNRLGFVEDELTELLSILQLQQNIVVKTVFSHLAASEEAQLDRFTEEQIATFLRLSDKLIGGLAYSVKRHLLNSSGILRFPHAHFDYVRLGIGLYGVDSSSTIQDKLLPIGKLKTRVAQIKEVKEGESIGYSRKGMADKDLKIGVLAIGYADGYDRRFGNGIGEVFIAGHRARIIGNVCMDMCMVDITHIDDVHEGDEAEIYGKEISIIEQARKIGTIAYELLTRISGRVKRLYYLD